MSGLVVLVTGVNTFLGSELAGRLSAAPGVARVVGVDATLPQPAARARMGGAEFARADIRNPLISRIIEAAGVDTVVHAAASASPASSQARAMLKEMNVLGTMQLLAACQRSATVRSVIVRSTTAVYGRSPRDPAVCTEATEPHTVPTRGQARDAVDIEGYVRGFARRRPDVRVVVPRLAGIVGPTAQSFLTRYFSTGPIIPVPLGRDARLQLLHEADAVGVLQHLVTADFAGIVNVAGDGVLMLSQAIHRAGRIPLPIPQRLLGRLGAVLRPLGLGYLPADELSTLIAGRVVDTTRLRTVVGFTPQFDTVAAFDDFAYTLAPVVERETVHRVAAQISAGLGLRTETEGWSAVPPAATVRPTLVGISGQRVGPNPAGRRRRS